MNESIMESRRGGGKIEWGWRAWGNSKRWEKKRREKGKEEGREEKEKRRKERRKGRKRKKVG